MTEPVNLSWEMTLPVKSRAAAWRVFADTDRFNRAAGLGFSFEEAVGPDGRVHRVGAVRRMGLTLKWIDDPFQLVAPEWFRSVRRFLNGPLKRLTTTVHLRRVDAGVRLTYEVELQARNWLARPLVALDARTSIQPMLDRNLQAAASQLGESPQPFDVPPPLSSSGERLLGRLDGLVVADRLRHLLRHGSLRDQDRLRPLALARAWKLDSEQVVRDLMAAVERGVLEVRFDLICPSCLGAKNRPTRFDLTPGEWHCASCRITYDGSFPDSVEVSLRPTAAVRDFEVPLDCVHSPSHTPHILARTLLAGGAETTWRVHLKPGAYRLVTEPPSGAASVEVRPGLRADAMAIDVHPDGVVPPILRAGPGPVEIALRSRLDEPVHVMLMERWRPLDALTAGRLLELPEARGLLPDAALPPGLDLATRRVALLVVDGRARPALLDGLRDATTGTHDNETVDLDRVDAPARGPIVCVKSEGCWIGAWPDAQGALDAARRLLPAPHLALALDLGGVSIVRDRGRATLSGLVVDRAIAAARRLGVGRLGMPGAALEDPELASALTRAGLRVVRAPGSDLAWVPTPAPPPDPESELPLMVGGRYDVGEELGRGGMGAVYAARDRDTGQDVVVKALLPDFAIDPSHVQRFFWEARVAARIDHPNTVRVLDHGLQQATAWLVMERLHGQELRERLLDVDRVPVDTAVTWALGVLEGLAAAHEAGIVHRDVKPANVFLCREPRPDHPKVLDFGIAVAVEDELADEDDVILGTPRYLAPEQVDRLPLDGRADLYAVGLVLYEMVSNAFPFEASSARALAFARLAKDPAPLSEVAPEVPDAVAGVIMKALATDRTDRWSSASEMADALRRALDGEAP